MLNKTHYSLLESITTPQSLVKHSKSESVCICDTSLSGIVEFVDACKKFGRKPIIGRNFGNFAALAINYDGYLDLVKLNNLEATGTLKEVPVSDNLYYIVLDVHQRVLPLLPIENCVIGLNNITDTGLLLDLASTYNVQTSAFPITMYEESGTRFNDFKLLLAINSKKKTSELEAIPNNYYIGYNQGYSGREIQCAHSIFERISEFNIFQKPRLPLIGQLEDLKKIAREGWEAKIKDLPKEVKKVYTERILHELEVISSVDILIQYFLIVTDFIQYAKNQGMYVGCGRGSVGGSLLAYLLGITEIDPIEYGLMFERFYNAGRNTKDKVSLPDVDTDFEIYRREEVISYLRNKYGHDRVAQITTFGTLQGRSALKEVLRMQSNLSFDEINKITENIPDKAEIADELQEMEEHLSGSSSIIKWALENRPTDFDAYASIEEDNVTGELANYFQQAIRIENTKRTASRHAAGVVISSDSLMGTCPIRKDNNEELIINVEMNSAERLGFVKFDCLGVAVLDKIVATKKLIEARHGEASLCCS